MKYDDRLSFRCTADTRKMLEDRARLCGVSLSRYMILMIERDSDDWEVHYHGGYKIGKLGKAETGESCEQR